MKVAIHQPSFFPWLGWLHKVRSADVYIFLDNVQIAERSFQHRNIFLTNNGQEKYLSVGIAKKGFLDLPLKDIAIREDIKWQKEHLNFFKGNYSNHPYYHEVMSMITPVYEKKYAALGDVLMDVVEISLELFNIRTKVVRQSQIEYDADAKKNDLVLSLVKSVGGTTYLSGQGAKSYMDDESFRKNGIEVEYQEFAHPYYKQKNTGLKPDTFKKGIAALDLLFNEGAEESARLLASIK